MGANVSALRGETRLLDRAASRVDRQIAEAINRHQHEAILILKAQRRAIDRRRNELDRQIGRLELAPYVGQAVRIQIRAKWAKRRWLRECYGRLVRVNPKTCTIDFGASGQALVRHHCVEPLD